MIYSEGPCCDVCEAQIECEDATTHIRTVLEVIQNMPNFGEVKVRRTHPLAKLSCICTQIAEAIRGSSKAKESAPKNIFGNGGKFGLSIDRWRERIRQAWMLNLLSRKMAVGKGDNLHKDMAFNTFCLSPEGEDFLTTPITIQLPQLSAKDSSLYIEQDEEVFSAFMDQ